MINPGRVLQHLEGCLIIATADCAYVLELGCYLGDRLAVCTCGYKLGVDIHQPYIDIAKKRWGRPDIGFICEDARLFVASQNCSESYGAILMVDFIEHLLKPDAIHLIADCKILARRIVVFCPEGCQPQDRDILETGGDQYQTHRSEWVAEELKEIGFDVATWKDHNGPGANALFATWEQT